MSELEDRIAKKATRFDIPSLMASLEAAGYADEEIRFRGSPEPSLSAGLVVAVDFEVAPRRAVVTLDLGLNGHRGFLPAYFEQIAEGLTHPELLHRFIEFFEDGLLRDYVAAAHPELSVRWHKLVQAQYAQLGLGSISTLSWLFAAFFPELGIRVRRAGLRGRTTAHALVVGQSPLDGTHVLGSTADAHRSGFTVELFTAEEHLPSGRTWWREAQARVHGEIIPRLGTDVPLEVILRIEEHESWATVAEDGLLGYDRVRGPRGPHEAWVHQDVTFSV
ncbi:MAG: hypothetical protein AAFZ18_36065 [Myxococcota bacterium]